MSKYVFREIEDLEAFNKFSEENGGSIYQTSYWAKVKANWKPTYFMGYDGETPVLSALCLERDVKMTKLWYADWMVVEPNIPSHKQFELTPYEEAIAKADVIVVLVKHSKFKGLVGRKSGARILNFCDLDVQ